MTQTSRTDCDERFGTDDEWVRGIVFCRRPAGHKGEHSTAEDTSDQ